MHLSADDAKLFFSTWVPLITWVSQKLREVPPSEVPSDRAPSNRQTVVGVRDAMWKRQDLLDRYVRENPMGASEVELSLVRGFEHRVAGKFVLLKHLAKSSIFIGTTEPVRVFHVMGISNPILEGHPVPTLVEAVLVPFGDVITYDSLITPHPVSYGPGARRMLNEAYQEAKAAGAIVVSLGPDPRPLAPPAKKERASSPREAPTNVVPLRQPQGASDVEWIGGIAEIEGMHTHETGSARLAASIWLTSTGQIARAEAGLAHELLANAGSELRAALASPRTKAPRPTRLRVASITFADALRKADPSLTVVVAATPEIDVAAADLARSLRGGPPSHLSGGASADEVGAALLAAKEVYQAAPWKKLPPTDVVFVVDVPALGVAGAAIVVVGQKEPPVGLMIHESLERLRAFDAAEPERPDDEDPDAQSYLAVSFDATHEMGPELLAETNVNGWATPGRNLHTRIVFYGHAGPRGPTSEEAVFVAVAARAITSALRDSKPLVDAWNGGAPYRRVLRVASARGEVDVMLASTPMPGADHGALRALVDLLLDRDAAEEDLDVGEDALLQCFDRSPEAEALGDGPSFLAWLMDGARRHLGCSLVATTRDELRHLVFDIVPERESIPASEAEPLLAELRAFYMYLARSHGSTFASHAVAVGPSHVAALRAAMSDVRRYAPAKAVAMAAMAAGVDPSSREAMSRFMATHQPGVSPLGARAGKPDAGAKAAKRNARKAASKARKKNR